RRPSKPLAVYSRPGHCSHCQHWLGESPAPSAEGGPDAAKGPDAALCRAEAIGELLAIVPRLEGCSLHSVLTATLRACVDIVTREASASTKWIGISANRSPQSTGNQAVAICGRSPTQKGSVSASIFEGSWRSPWLRSGQFRPIGSLPASDTPTMDTCGSSFRI